jgi:uncharacterized lipoprotein NlpE involved in copper resistance
MTGLPFGDLAIIKSVTVISRIDPNSKLASYLTAALTAAKAASANHQTATHFAPTLPLSLEALDSM